VLVCAGVVDVDVDALETVVDQAAPRGVREAAEEVVVVLDTQRLSRLSQCDREVNAGRGTRRHNVAAAGRSSAAVAWRRRQGEQRYAVILGRRVIRISTAHQRRTSARARRGRAALLISELHIGSIADAC
jgi:hypothetical protein